MNTNRDVVLKVAIFIVILIVAAMYPVAAAGDLGTTVTIMLPTCATLRTSLYPTPVATYRMGDTLTEVTVRVFVGSKLPAKLDMYRVAGKLEERGRQNVETLELEIEGEVEIACVDDDGLYACMEQYRRIYRGGVVVEVYLRSPLDEWEKKSTKEWWGKMCEQIKFAPHQ